VKIADAQVLEVISLCIGEARACATIRKEDGVNVLGMAAMSTLFSCVLAVGEAVLTKRGRDCEVIAAFCREMADSQSWLIHPQGRRADAATVSDVLTSLRNGLAHALSVPDGIKLLPDKCGTEGLPPDCWGIVVRDFVDAVEAAIIKITREKPGLRWDPGAFKQSRSPAYQTWGTTGAEPGTWVDRP